jgi:hypothetical protein
MTPTPEKVIQALSSIQRPRNQAQLILQAVNNDKTGLRPVSSCPVAGLHNNSGGRYGCQKYNAKVIHFPVHHLPVLPRSCARCSHTYRLPWMARSIRDEHEKVCPPCFIDGLREMIQ